MQKGQVIEEYKDIENNIIDAFDVSDASVIISTPEKKEHKILSLAGQIMQWVRVELEKNEMGNVSVLRMTNRKSTKRLKLRVTIRAGKSAQAVIKQFVAQELQVKKAKMQEWKENVI